MFRRIGLLLFLHSLLASCSALIPLIGWSNSDAFSMVKESQFMSANQFIYDASLDNIDMIVIFKTPELSFDNLAKYGGIFGGKNPVMGSLQSEIKGSKSSVWVGVDGSVASDLVSTLSFILGEQPHVISGADGLAKNQKLVQVELVSTSEATGFSEQDGVISEVMSALHSLPGSPSYAAIYTSSHAHLAHYTYEQREEVRRSVDEEEDFEYRIPREMEQELPNVTTLLPIAPYCTSISDNSSINSDSNSPPPLCMLFCFTRTDFETTNSTVEKNGADKIVSIAVSNIVEFLEGSCVNDTEVCPEYEAACLRVSAQVNKTDIAQINITDIDETELVELMFVFPRGFCDYSPELGGDKNMKCGFWTIELYVDGTRYKRATEETNIFSDFLIPLGVSYACGKNDLNIFRPFNTTEYMDEYRFFGLQVQMFSGISYTSNSEPVFGSVFNCQGYFTTVPLMGAVTVIILLLILYCSLVFIFSIKTMDKFDDPRGPTISVENLH